MAIVLEDDGKWCLVISLSMVLERPCDIETLSGSGDAGSSTAGYTAAEMVLVIVWKVATDTIFSVLSWCFSCLKGATM